LSEVKRWERLESEDVGDYGVFRVVRHRSRSPRDGVVYEFHVVAEPPSVVIVPLTEDGDVVLVEQFRHASQRAELEFPAGFVDDGEDAVTAALRELQEETGYCAADATRITEYVPDPAKFGTPVQLVVARGCTPAGDGDQDAGEDVHVRVVRAAEVPALVRDGTIRSAPAITAWALYELLAADGG
jgi:ADP-ribose pyrophosphatase